MGYSITEDSLDWKYTPSILELEAEDAVSRRMTLHDFQTTLNTDAYRSRHAPWLTYVDFQAQAPVDRNSVQAKESVYRVIPKPLRLEQTTAYNDLVQVEDVLQDHYRSSPGQPLPANILYLRQNMDHLLVAAFLLENGVTDEYTNFMRAMEEKSYPMLEFCVCYGLDINGDFPLWSPKPLAETFGDEQLTRWFLDHGADPNAEKKGETPLSISMWRAPFDIIGLLFDRGGPRSIKQGSLLWYAVNRTLPDYMRVLEYLFGKGAATDLNKLKHHNRPDLAYEDDWIIGRGTPLHTAARSGRLDVVKMFVSLGADPCIRSSTTTARVSEGRLPIDEARTQLRLGEKAGDFEGIIEFLEPLSHCTTEQNETSFVGLERL
ncbi:MAG: hypothetical protein Q9166_006878 [cf. Caloplaca sp. 2 TL-2023]